MVTVGVSTTVESTSLEAILTRLTTQTAPPAMRQYLEGRGYRWLQSRIMARFHTEGDDATGKWARLKLATMRIRANKGFPPAHPINVRTGAMQRFITSSKLVRTNATGASLRIPARTPGGELGAKFRRAQVGDARTVRRPLIGLSLLDAEELTDDLERFIWTGIGGE